MWVVRGFRRFGELWVSIYQNISNGYTWSSIQGDFMVSTSS